MRRGGKGNAFGPMIIFIALLAFIIMMLTFMPLIFGEAEATANVSGMDNETAAAYEASSGVVVVSHNMMYILGIVVTGAVVVFGLYLAGRW
jgi:hypothetical protein